MSLVFVDSNIFMYAVGTPHPYKEPSLFFFQSVVQKKESIAISVEILQEILYRFWSIGKMEEGMTLFEYAHSLSEWVLPISEEEILKAKEVLKQHPPLGPRDSLHVATMIKNRISTIISYDKDFDKVKGIKRIEPFA